MASKFAKSNYEPIEAFIDHLKKAAEQFDLPPSIQSINVKIYTTTTLSLNMGGEDVPFGYQEEIFSGDSTLIHNPKVSRCQHVTEGKNVAAPGWPRPVVELG